jgi:hypothetical protein
MGIAKKPRIPQPSPRPPMRSRKMFRTLILAGLIAGTITAAVPALAAPADFTIGIPGKTGCLVCHGDSKLTQIKSKKSLYISESEMLASVHKDVPCTKCHTDFDPAMASQSHQGLKSDPRKVAGLSCKNCHEHSAQLKVYNKSTHGRGALSGDAKAPTCADCHGSHNIQSFKKNKAYAADFRMQGMQVCGKCHKKYYDSYSDYYHGRAYKMKAVDAPTCWDCHGTHEILASKNTESKTAKANLPKTCGKCHPDSRNNFAQFAKLIHGRPDVFDKNIVIVYKGKIMDWFNVKVLGKPDTKAKEKPLVENIKTTGAETASATAEK